MRQADSASKIDRKNSRSLGLIEAGTKYGSKVEYLSSARRSSKVTAHGRGTEGLSRNGGLKTAEAPRAK
jgi:hypothetical protein